jgi:hypothetical protein
MFSISSKRLFDLSRLAALVGGVLVPLLHTVRCVLWGRWPESLAQWVIAVDAYVVGALLLAGGIVAARSHDGRLLTGAWGFALGIVYRSFFEQLHDPTRHAGHEVIVLVVKGVCLVTALAGFVASVASLSPRVSRAA